MIIINTRKLFIYWKTQIFGKKKKKNITNAHTDVL